MNRRAGGRHGWASSTALTLFLCTAVLGAQTQITPPKNKYTPEQDVQLGREAAAEVRREYPLINDERIDSYLDGLGRRLVAASPADLKHPAFEYSFTPVNLKDINAFALPGGPMFVNRGMIEAASTEGEVAGVMAHELAHVLLRHGTANATKAQASKWIPRPSSESCWKLAGANTNPRAKSVAARGPKCHATRRQPAANTAAQVASAASLWASTLSPTARNASAFKWLATKPPPS